ncbi:Predicted acetyltransferase,ribosomal-protein-alanine acetyltransferase,Acetyltransferase (GNAT) family [Burkholderia stabilis]|uniref:Predicted acetyltransferase,ribosomal-protein-alanine acetyltransferase,Acetyltransferase (GNAT) family n=1 Tax=Burkholderia stabilis TaxID=95485 RepID=A0AAJ5NG85_9BURK|nr:Predicted acetyltransferase,ribosomal-protein-alanine acetyltransferase,Acetyltransferase (GNAT) family [Burkholderia stabilis]
MGRRFSWPAFDRFPAIGNHARRGTTFPSPVPNERVRTVTYAISLRTASATDLPFLLTLRRLTMTEHLQRVGEPTDDDAHDRRIRAHFDDAMIVCEGAEAIGLLKVTRAADEWHVHQIQILPARQGRGIGEAVLRELLGDAARENVPVSLSVLHGNPARKLYERLGFRLASETDTSTSLVWRA